MTTVSNPQVSPGDGSDVNADISAPFCYSGESLPTNVYYYYFIVCSSIIAIHDFVLVHSCVSMRYTSNNFMLAKFDPRREEMFEFRSKSFSTAAGSSLF